jgi:hypothetical protein
MRRVTTIGLVLLIAICATAKAQDKNQATSTPPTKLHGSGCVEAGTEAGCLVLKEFGTSEMYGLFFAAKKPQVGTAISFEGTKHDGPTICMQGIPVDVTKWTILKRACTP